MAKLKMDLSIKNIGPHENLNYQNNLSKIQIGIYARNGEGKTFISRAFRAFEVNDAEKNTYANYILNNQATTGSFSFSVGDKQYSYAISKSGITDLKNDNSRIFYTFNSDYIKENFVASNYKLTGNINGYILGKDNIDLSQEKNKLESLKRKGLSIKQNIEDNISTIKSELIGLGITKKQKSFQNITYDALKEFQYNDILSFENAKLKLTGFNSLPENIMDIAILELKCMLYEKRNEITDILNTEYTLNNFKESFRKDVQQKMNFIKEGVKYYDDKSRKCPFCHQELNDTGIQWINQYIAYVNDQESIVNEKIASYISLGENSVKEIDSFLETMQASINFAKPYFQFFGDIDEECLKDIRAQLASLKEWILNTIQSLHKKQENISKSIQIENYGTYEEINNSIKKMNSMLSSFNKSKNDISKNRKKLKDMLCEASLNKLKSDNKSKFEEISKISQECKDLQKYITEQEYRNKKSKKELVAADFKKYLDKFFNGKYTFDPNTFLLSLNSHKLDVNPDQVLSDGEKTILSFCYYLSNIHTKINNTEDYDKIILVIDDPISSMDFDYIYQLTSIIKNYGIANNSIKFEKYIILTHNLDFYNLLCRTKITSLNLCLNHSELKSYPINLIMPYEFHLKDIYLVATGKMDPSYTIGNSIRHVLETQLQFEGYDKCSANLEKLISENSEFSNELEIYTYMQDLSHGGVRFDQPQNNQMIIKACKAVVDYINHHYPQQILNCQQIKER